MDFKQWDKIRKDISLKEMKAYYFLEEQVINLLDCQYYQETFWKDKLRETLVLLESISDESDEHHKKLKDVG